MKLDILKYTLKVSLPSLLFLYPLTFVILKIIQNAYVNTSDAFYIGASQPNHLFWLIRITYSEVLTYILPFLVVFFIVSIILNNLFTKTKTIKTLLTLLVILANTIAGFFDIFSMFLITGKIIPNAFLFLLLFFIWIFKLKSKPIEVEIPDILDA